MFKSAATKLAHSSAIRAVAPGNSDLRPLQEIITTEKVVLQSLQKLSTDFCKSVDALRTWAGGEGEDLENTFSACATLLYHWVSSLASFADNIANVRECLKAIRTREEALGEMRRSRRTLMSKADSTDKRLNKMSPGDKNFPQQTGLLTGLREQIDALDAEIIDEEASFYDSKRDNVREWMGVLLGGLLECSATGAVVATSGRTIIDCVPTEPTQPGLPRAHYSGHSQVELIVAEAERTIRKISTIGEAGISFGSEAGVSFISDVAGETSQLPSGSGVGNVHGNPPSTLSLPIQPTPVQPIQPIPVQPMPVQPIQPIPIQPIQPIPVQPIPVQSMPVQPIQQMPVQPIQQMPVQPIQQMPVQPIQPTPFQPIQPYPSLTLPNNRPSNPHPVQPIQPYPSLTLPNNHPSNPHEVNDFGEYNPWSPPPTYTPGQWSHLSQFDEPSNPAGPSVLSPSHPPRPLGLTRDVHGLASSSSSSAIRPTSTHQSAQERIVIEEQIMLDAEIAKHLQEEDGDGDIYTDEMQEAEWMYDSETTRGTLVQGVNDTFSPITSISENTEMWSDGKGKAKEQEEPPPDYPVSNAYPICGICLEQFQVTYSPILASMTPNSSARLPFGLRLPCPGEHTYCLSCVSEYIKRKLDPSGTDETNTNITVFPIPCPECPIANWESGIQDEVAERVFDAEAMSSWHHRRLLDSLPKRYCPNPKCSVLVQVDEHYYNPKAQCPGCFLWVCIPCEAMWHNDMTCEKYQSLPPDERSPEDQLLIELAKSEQWRRCPGCQAIVERNEGCNHMTCLCGMEFCFRCGALWSTTLRKCGNDPPCVLFGGGVLLDGVNNAGPRPASPPSPSPSPRSITPSPPPFIHRGRIGIPPPVLAQTRGRSFTPPRYRGRSITPPLIRRPVTPPSPPPSPPPEFQQSRGQGRPSKLHKRSGTRDCVTQ